MIKVMFVDDIFRREILEARQCIYKTLFALFKRAFGIEIVAPRFEKGIHNIFSNLQKKYSYINWTQVYFELPKEIEEEYTKLLDIENTIYISYEAPIWLFKIWKKHNIKYLDLRLSYLRFLPDIPVMFSTNILSMIPMLKKFEIQEDDIFYEADLLKASYNFRHYTDYLNLKRYAEGLVVIGQTNSDTSLMVEGHEGIIKFADYEQEIKKIFCQYKKIFYKKHPFACKDHEKYELSYLSYLLNEPISICSSNFYNLATQDFKIDFLGLSSGAIKEAYYFGKTSYMLIDYPFERYENNNSIMYLNIKSYYFFSPKFWQELMGKELSISRKCINYREPHRNIMREHHNASWGFNEFYFENRMSNNDRILAKGSIFKDIFQYKENIRRYWRYKLLSKITFGEKRKKYKQKRNNLKVQLKTIRQFLKGK